MIQNTVTIQLDEIQRENAEEILEAYGWKEEYVNNPYAKFRMKSPQSSNVILYTSGKLVFQGSEDFTSIITAIKNNREDESDIIPHLGVDEVGKGDYFGPLVVVACFLDEEFLEKISSIGIGDSKKFSDSKIMEMYNLVKDYPYFYISIVHPKEYAQLYKESKNASILLARQHSKVIEMGLGDLKSKNIECSRVVIDQFSSRKARILNELGNYGKEIELIQFHKGESDMAVACASVMARGIFLEEMEKMRKKYNFNFPKGASDVIDKGQEFVKKFGVEELGNVAKISFKTTAKVLQIKL